ncbi:MAG: phosphopantetheine-binding protein, partial [Holophagales bacterium]|nr:phosphopantetheine-binding protein [Holophagales bacterium]
SMGELYAYLRAKVPWVRPEDTGRSTNCSINDAGIYVHQAERGFHNYALPYSWDVRLGHKTREAAMEELDDQLDEARVRQMLAEVGYEPGSASRGETTTLEAFYETSPSAPEPTADALRRHLAGLLPAPLVPSRLQRVDALPLTPHGKVDHEALARQSEPSGATPRPYTPPEGPVARALAELWQRELALDRVGAHDHFFELGGTSLTAMAVMLGLCEEFDIDLPLETIFANPTLEGLARQAEDRILADAEALAGG